MIAVTIDQAAKVAPVGRELIRDAIKRGDLVAHYIGIKAVILVDDLKDWIRTLPTERAS